MSLRVFSFHHPPMEIPVTVQGFRPPELSSAAGGSPNFISPSDTDAPSRLRGAAHAHRPIEDALFGNRVDLKVLVSKVAMHLSSAQRADLFKQIDELLSAEDWTVEEQTISLESFRAFLRFLIYFRNIKRPSLTVTGESNIAASWFGAGERLTLEFLSGDRVRLVMYRSLEDQDAETVAYQGPIGRVETVVAGFGRTPWDRDGSA